MISIIIIPATSYASTAYGNVVEHSSPTGSSGYDWRAILTYSTSETATSVTITASLSIFAPQNMGEVGKYTTSSLTGGGTLIESTTKTSWSLRSEHKTLISNKTWTVNKGATAQPHAIIGKIFVDSPSHWKGISTATATVTIPAIASRTVYYNANGGELATPNMGGLVIAADGTIMHNGAKLQSKSSIINLYDYNYTAGLNLQKTGYHINVGAEWNSNAAGTGTAYNQASDYPYTTFSDGQTVYANWKPNTYTLKFFPNAENAEGAMNDQVLTYDKEEKVRASAFVNPGFKLVGWDTNPDATPEDTLTVRGNQGIVKNLTSVNNGVINLYAIWRPIEDSEADIYAGKILQGAGVTDSFSFRIEPVEGWKHENESTLESGQEIPKEEVPMPEDTPLGQLYKDITISGFSNNTNNLLIESFGLISFEEPGWYMYKVSELIPSPKATNVVYDKTSYYVVTYVEYKEETGYKVKVSNTTAWHNGSGSSGNRPTLRDISEITDNDGNPAQTSAPKTYGKVGSGVNGIVTKFWNTDYAFNNLPPSLAGFYISKNVVGNLGDTTKLFEYTGTFSGLSANTTYAINNEKAILGNGFTGNSFTTNASGVATISFKLKDDTGFGVEDLPINAKFEITEDKSDHFPSYKITTEAGTVKTDAKNSQVALSTGTITMSQADTYSVTFTNSRDLTQNTGVLDRNLPVGAIVVLLLLTTVFIIRIKK